MANELIDCKSRKVEIRESIVELLMLYRFEVELEKELEQELQNAKN